jgi:FkbM family methyltransferase
MIDDVLIYGAGGMGRELAAHLRQRGLTPRCFIDRRAAQLIEVDGIAVLDAAQAALRHAGSSVTVLVGTHSFAHAVADMLVELRAAGFTQVLSLWDYCTAYHWAPVNGYWLQPGLRRGEHAGPMAQARALLADAFSEQVFDQQCRLRFEGDYLGLQRPDPAGQYDPDDLPALVEPLRLIDCGAFDGDTLRALARRHRLAEVIALEPDPHNYVRLQATLQQLGVGKALRVGAASFDGVLHFSAGQGGASHVDSAGEMSIDVVTIDQLCSAFRPNFIKMDIEGAEHDALDGAVQTIRRDRPRLALSAYHRPDDLWTLLLKVDAWQLGYQFYLRSHGNNGFDTVLYALPSPAH